MKRENFLLLIIFNFIKLSNLAKNPSIVIIGAGPAGIAAVTRLLENNFKNVLILEAEPRIGGRINSVKFGEAYVDLGAGWCHGQKNNIVYDLVKNLNILKHTGFTEKFHHSSRKYISDNFSKELLSIMASIYEKEEEYSSTDFVNLGEYCTYTYNKIINEKYKNDPEKLEIAEDAFDYFHHYVLGWENSFSWYDNAVDVDFEESEGDLALGWNGRGYKIFLDILMKKYPDPSKQLPIDDKIFLNKEVVRILWDSTKLARAITIYCSDRSVYNVDHVIFTPSIGVLKEKAQDLFSPNLSVKKMNAINDIGYGALMRVYLEFPYNWWGNLSTFNFIWGKKDITSVLKEYSEGPSWDNISWITYVHVTETQDRNPNVLLAWFTGHRIPVIENLSDKILKNGIYFTLQKFLGHIYTIPKPIRILKSQWYSNPHFRGSYSFQTPNSKKGNKKTSAEEDLATPIRNIDGKPILQFAGEATNPHHFSTVHGAVETGFREANILIDLYL